MIGSGDLPLSIMETEQRSIYQQHQSK